MRQNYGPISGRNSYHRSMMTPHILAVFKPLLEPKPKNLLKKTWKVLQFDGGLLHDPKNPMESSHELPVTSVAQVENRVYVSNLSMSQKSDFFL